MPGGLTTYGADNIIGTAVPTTMYMKFHLADPGVDALFSPALHTTRKAMDFIPADLPAKFWNDDQADWPGIAANETIPWFSLWDAVAAGNPWFVGEFDPVMELVNSSTASLAAHRCQIYVTPYEP